MYLRECVNLALFLAIPTALLMITAVFIYLKVLYWTEVKRNRCFPNPYVISSSVTSQLLMKLPNISMKNGDNLINLMMNFVIKVQLANSKLSKDTTNFM